MPRAIVLGGGLAGLASAAALGCAGFEIDVFESRPFLGGRAASYPIGGELIDNCQHVLLRCCSNLLDFYERLGVSDRIRFYDTYYFLEPGGRKSTLKAGSLPAPLHFTGSFLSLRFLTAADKLRVARGFAALRAQSSPEGLDRVSMLDWLRAHGQSETAIARFWAPVLVSAINEDLDRMAALHGFQVFRLAFLERAEASQMGIPAVTLGELYSPDRWHGLPEVRLHTRAPVDRIEFENGRVAAIHADGERHTADFYISALPYDKLQPLAPALPIDTSALGHSPITGIHLWFDRAVTDLPHASLLDRTLHWFFNKRDGRYLQLVVSASRSLIPMSRQEIVELACRELAEFLPEVRGAKLESAHVVKEVKATFSAAPGTEAMRPPSGMEAQGLYLAGDWTRSGWPATMEGAVRSGYLTAEAVCHAAGVPGDFVLDRRAWR